MSRWALLSVWLLPNFTLLPTPVVQGRLAPAKGELTLQVYPSLFSLLGFLYGPWVPVSQRADWASASIFPSPLAF